MRVAHILPPAALPYVDDLIGSYHLLLPDLIKFSGQYRATYKARQRDYMMVDNGVAEGKRTSFDEQMHMAQLLEAQEIVLPDVLRDQDKTLAASQDVIWKAFDMRRRFRFMFVPQGKNVNEIVHCARRADAMFPNIIHSFGIPRHIIGKSKAARVEIAQRLRSLWENKDIHLLGMHPLWSGEIDAYINAFQNLGVRGVDSSLAWNAAIQGVLLGPESLSYNYLIERQPIGVFGRSDVNDRTIDLLRQNIQFMNEWSK